MNRSVVCALALATSLLGCSKSDKTSGPGPDVTASLAKPTLAGAAFDPSALAGKVTFVNFWNPG